MHIQKLSVLILQAIEAYQDSKEAYPLRGNKSVFFGKEKPGEKHKKKYPDCISMSEHIFKVIEKEISGATLLQSFYNKATDFLKGSIEDPNIGVSPESVDILNEYIQKSGGILFSQPRKVDSTGLPGFDQSKLEYFFDTTWYVYSHEEYSDQTTAFSGKARESFLQGIGRTVLMVDSKGIVTISNYQEAYGKATYNTDYRGKITFLERDSIEFLLTSSDDSERHLHMRMLRSPASKQSLAMGGYINRGLKNGLLMGALVFVKQDPKEINIYPTFLKVGSPEFRELDPAIRNYLESRKYNYLRVPANIPGTGHLVGWLNREKSQSINFPDKYENYKNDIFIAAPFSSLDEKERLSLKTGIDGINDTIKKKLGLSKIYSAMWGTGNEKDFWDPNAIKDARVLYQIKSCRFFILIFPERVQSSSLVEIGYALSFKKPTIVFYRDLHDLPNIIRQSDSVDCISFIKKIRFSQYNDIASMIQKRPSIFDWV